MTSGVNTKQIEQQLIQHLNVMYGGNAQPHQIKESNEFLTKFNKHPKAWSVCLNILSQMSDAQSMTILQFSAQTVYDNLLENWRTISIQQRMQIVSTLQSFISSFCEKYLCSYLQPKNDDGNNSFNESMYRFIFNKTCQSIALLALNSNEAANMMQSVFSSCLSLKLPQQLCSLWVNLEILNAFALEFGQQHVSQSIIRKTQSFLNANYKDTFLKIMLCSLQLSHKQSIYRLMQITFSTLKHWINVSFCQHPCTMHLLC